MGPDDVRYHMIHARIFLMTHMSPMHRPTYTVVRMIHAFLSLNIILLIYTTIQSHVYVGKTVNEELSRYSWKKSELACWVFQVLYN